jgi:hypothetical protein
VFLNSPYRETPKNVKKRGHFLGFGWFLESQSNIRSGPSCLFWVPLGLRQAQCTIISRKTSDSKDKFNGENPLDIAITNCAIANALELIRGQNFENWPRGDPRATRHAKYEQKYGQNEHLDSTRKQSPWWPQSLTSLAQRSFSDWAIRFLVFSSTAGLRKN